LLLSLAGISLLTSCNVSPKKTPVETAPATAPVFSLPSGSYTSIQSVSITDTIPSATIYYTTDGSTPSTSSPVYSASITVNTSVTLNAIAAAPGYSTSSVASASYEVELTTASPVFSPAAGSYASAVNVTISDATPNSTIYYTTDGTMPSTSSVKYPAPSPSAQA
jgi:Chitobiase/beta-hexosaminidase C-terminal domain